jgi:hypothetical protein
LLPTLAETLRAGPTGELAFICGSNGKPMTKESFGQRILGGLPESRHQEVGARPSQARGDESRRGRPQHRLN